MTVIEMIRRHGFEPDRHLSWACGDAVRDEYRKRFGRLPEKSLRQKTNGKGSHCFAVYQGGFVSDALEIVRRVCVGYRADKERQRPLF